MNGIGWFGMNVYYRVVLAKWNIESALVSGCVCVLTADWVHWAMSERQCQECYNVLVKCRDARWGLISDCGQITCHIK